MINSLLVTNRTETWSAHGLAALEHIDDWNSIILVQKCHSRWREHKYAELHVVYYLKRLLVCSEPSIRRPSHHSAQVGHHRPMQSCAMTERRQIFCCHLAKHAHLDVMVHLQRTGYSYCGIGVHVQLQRQPWGSLVLPMRAPSNVYLFLHITIGARSSVRIVDRCILDHVFVRDYFVVSSSS